jgi:hypothetical protein
MLMRRGIEKTKCFSMESLEDLGEWGEKEPTRFFVCLLGQVKVSTYNFQTVTQFLVLQASTRCG